MLATAQTSCNIKFNLITCHFYACSPAHVLLLEKDFCLVSTLIVGITINFLKEINSEQYHFR